MGSASNPPMHVALRPNAIGHVCGRHWRDITTQWFQSQPARLRNFRDNQPIVLRQVVCLLSKWASLMKVQLWAYLVQPRPCNSVAQMVSTSTKLCWLRRLGRKIGFFLISGFELWPPRHISTRWWQHCDAVALPSSIANPCGTLASVLLVIRCAIS